MISSTSERDFGARLAVTVASIECVPSPIEPQVRIIFTPNCDRSISHGYFTWLSCQTGYYLSGSQLGKCTSPCQPWPPCQACVRMTFGRAQLHRTDRTHSLRNKGFAGANAWEHLVAIANRANDFLPGCDFKCVWHRSSRPQNSAHESRREDDDLSRGVTNGNPLRLDTTRTEREMR